MSKLPTYEEAAALREVTRLVVPASFIDANDHVNVACYLELAGGGVGKVLSQCGAGPHSALAPNSSIFSAEQHLTYVSEVLLGEEVTVHTRLLQRSARAVHAMSFVVNRTRPALSLVFEVVLLNIDMRTRRTAPFSHEIAHSLDVEIERDLQASWPAPLSDRMSLRL